MVIVDNNECYKDIEVVKSHVITSFTTTHKQQIFPNKQIR